MTSINFQAPAELYLGSDWQTARAQGSRAFRTAANAIRFALEEAAPVSLRGAQLHLDGRTYTGEQIRSLYRSHSYPLVRKHPIDGTPGLSTKGHLSMTPFDYETMAELYPSRRYAKTSLTQYRRFSRAAEAIRSSWKTSPPTAAPVRSSRSMRRGSRATPSAFSMRLPGIRYEAPGYPLTRQLAAA